MATANIARWLTAKVKADSTLSTLINDRFFPQWIPQNSAIPSVVYTVSERPADNSKTQKSTNYIGDVDITIWGTSYDDLVAIDFAFRALLDYGESNDTNANVNGAEWVSSSDTVDEKMEYLGRVCRYSFRYRDT